MLFLEFARGTERPSVALHLQNFQKYPSIYSGDIWFGIILAQIGYICHCMTPLLLFYIYGNLV